MFRDFKIGVPIPQNHGSGDEIQSQQGEFADRSSSRGNSTQSETSTSTETSPVSSISSSSTTSSGLSKVKAFQIAEPSIANRSRRFLELCVNTGGYVVSLGEIEVSITISDGDLFDRICTKYRELRGSSWKRMLMHPVNVHYVEV